MKVVDELQNKDDYELLELVKNCNTLMQCRCCFLNGVQYCSEMVVDEICRRYRKLLQEIHGGDGK